jgi:heme/copper-type cytochrome/quinol oxidase subunit 2
MEETSELLQSTQQSSSILALLVIVFAVITVFAVVLFINNRRKAAQPKYGFLGKTINSLLLFAVLVGGVGFVYYSTLNQTNEFSDVSADSELDASIVINQIDTTSRTYQFRIIPTIDGVEWGGNNSFEFDIQWTIENGEVYQTIENGLSIQNSGGISLSLKQGTYTVSAAVFVGDKSIIVDLTQPLEVR